MKILIAYISKTGTTEEIARRIGAIMEEKSGGARDESTDNTPNNARIDVLPISEVDVSNLQNYDRFILGSPINGMKVLPEFKTFISEKIAGVGKPVDIFIVSYMYERGRKMWRNAIRKDAEKIRALAGASSVEIFGGRIPSPLPGFARVIFGLPRDLPLDLRDWGKIEGWANTR